MSSYRPSRDPRFRRRLLAPAFAITLAGFALAALSASSSASPAISASVQRSGVASHPCRTVTGGCRARSPRISGVDRQGRGGCLRAQSSTNPVGYVSGSSESEMGKALSAPKKAIDYVEDEEGVYTYTIAGDIGGTNSRMALYKTNLDSDDLGEVLYSFKYKNAPFDSFTSVVKRFIDDATKNTGISTEDINSAAFAIAGPVFANTVKFTNLEWPIVDGEEMSETLGINIEIINDFVGLSQGLVTLERDDVLVINKGVPVENGVKCCVGAGTGLGEAFLTYNRDLKQYEAWPSEGGHSDFVPRTQEQLEMAHWIRSRIYDKEVCQNLGARISVERICSGGGLMNTYEFLRQRYPEKVDPYYDAKYEEADAKTKPAVITDGAFADMDNSLMGRTVKIFLSTLGSEVANAGLKFLPLGGVYIAGGIVPKLIERFLAPPESCDIFNPESCKGALMGGFEIYKTLKRDARDKGRMGELLDRIPVYIVTGEKVDTIAISGAQLFAKRLAQRKIHASN